MPVHLHPVSTPADALAMVTPDLYAVAEESDGALTLGTLSARILAGQATLWLILSGGAERYVGCLVTEVLAEDPPKVHVVAMRVRAGAGGEVFAEALEKLGAWAADAIPGARLTGTSRRPGMARHLARLGWKPRFVEYVAPEVST